MKRTAISIGLLAATAAIIGFGLGAAQEPRAPKGEPPVGVLMRAKLASSQKIMEGLVTEQFDLIAAGAKELHKVSEAAEWRGSNDPVYNHHSAEFRRLCEKLMRMAEAHNLDGASFTYLHTTTTCISCHQHVRDVVRMAQEGQPRGREIPPARPVPKKAGKTLRTSGTLPESSN